MNVPKQQTPEIFQGVNGMPNRTESKVGTELTTPYVPSAEDRALIQAYAARKPTPRLKVTPKGEGATVGCDHPEPAIGQLLLMQALGTTETDFIDGIVLQLVKAGNDKHEYDAQGPNFMLAVVKGLAPKDQIETMLAAQMAAVHMLTMTFARRLGRVDNIPQQDSASNAFNKLARTFAVQLEALKRYRTGGEQRMTVQHVTVNDGGQAIVGTVSAGQRGGGTTEKSKATP
jgi:hypothetical protein